MKFRRTLRRDEVMRRLAVALWSPPSWAYAQLVDPAEASRARPQLAEDEQIGGEARVGDPRQCSLGL